MNWDALGAVAELTAAFGVIASLFYLGAQIRQNTRSVRASSYHALVTNIANVASDLGRDPAGADVFVRGQADLQLLDPTEQRQFGLLLQSIFRSFENIFYQFHRGMIDDEVWCGWENRIVRYFWQPGVQAWWPTWRDDCHPEFRALLERSTPPGDSAVPLNLADPNAPRS